MSSYPNNFRMMDHAPLPIDMDAGLTRVKFDSGAHRQRRRQDGLPRMYSAVFTMQRSDFPAWKDWVNANAYDWFTMPLKNCAPAQVRFTTNLSLQFVSFERVKVSVSIEMDRRSVTPLPPVSDLWYVATTTTPDWVIAGGPPNPSPDMIGVNL